MRYTVPARPTSADDMSRVFWYPAAATIWISSPSRIHETPRPTTTDQWKRVHGRRSIRAGTRLACGPRFRAVAMRDVMNDSLRSAATPPHEGTLPAPFLPANLLSGGLWRAPVRANFRRRRRPPPPHAPHQREGVPPRP